ncbi:hypothetical protein GCM10008019_28620 [Deinococcus soli (ex Cha et al. 2016)]|nr:hypothetical protein GCM10008019_28620 [Deinococcus soli (ex Cha et al. 2016)]
MKRRSSTITLTLMTSVSLVACTESTEVSSTVDPTYEPTLVSSVLGAEKGSIDRLRYLSMTDCRNDWGADATLCVREAGQVVGPYMKRSGTQVNIIPTRSQNDPASARDYTGPQIDGSKTFNSLASGAVTLEHLNQNFTYYSFTAVRSGRLTASGAGGVRAHYPTRDACEGDWGKSDRPGFLTCFADGTTFAGPYFTQARPDQPVRFHYYLSDGAVSVLTAPAPDTIGVLPSGLLVTPFFAPSLQTSSGDRTPYVRDAYTWDPNSEAWSKLNVDAQRAVYTTP